MKQTILSATKLLTLITLLLILQNCTKNDLIENQNNGSNKNVILEKTPVVEKLLEMGFKIENIIEIEDYYVVEGDLLYSKNINDYPVNLFNENSTAKHKHSSYTVSDENIGNITIYTNFINSTTIPENNNEWNLQVIQNALDEFDLFPCIGFQLVDNPEDADIQIIGVGENEFTNSVEDEWPEGGDHILAWAFGYPKPPSCGKPYPLIWVNLEFEYTSSPQMPVNLYRDTIIHEIGHCLGFRHTDSNEGNTIPGTQYFTDPNSIMHEDLLIRDVNYTFTNNDITSLEYLYGCESDGNDNQNSSKIGIKSINPNPICLSDSFSVSGTYNTCIYENNATVEIYIKEIGSLNTNKIAENNFYNGGFTFPNINLTQILNFNYNPNSLYEIYAIMIDDDGSTQYSSFIELNINECDDDNIEGEINLINTSYEICDLNTINILGTYSNNNANNINITLSLIPIGNLVPPTVTVSENFDNNIFEFSINPTTLNLNSNYDYEINVKITGTDIEDNNSSNNSSDPDITFTTDCQNCAISNITNNASISNNILSWPANQGENYTVSFVSNTSCNFENNSEPENNIVTYTYSSFENSVDLQNISNILNRKCFNWIIKTDCSNWSSGCLIGIYDPTSFSFEGNCNN